MIISDYSAGSSSRALATRHELPKTTVLKVLRQAGVTRRQSSPTPHQVNEAVHLYMKEGWSLEQIGEHLSFQPNTIRKYLSQRHVEMRRPWDHLAR